MVATKPSLRRLEAREFQFTLQAGVLNNEVDFTAQLATSLLKKDLLRELNWQRILLKGDEDSEEVGFHGEQYTHKT